MRQPQLVKTCSRPWLGAPASSRLSERMPARMPAVPAAYLLLAGILMLLGAGPAAARRAWPQTRPEATGFAETSRYDDVMRS